MCYKQRLEKDCAFLLSPLFRDFHKNVAKTTCGDEMCGSAKAFCRTGGSEMTPGHVREIAAKISRAN